MSAIAGIWNLDGRPVEGEVLARLRATLAIDVPGHQVEQRRDGPIGVITRSLHTGPEDQTNRPLIARPSGPVIVFDGRLDNRDELLDALAPASNESRHTSDARLVLGAYDRFGAEFPERLVGDFAVGIFDSVRRQLVLARDAMGLRPLYFFSSPRTFLFASTIGTLLSHPAVSPRPNDATVARLVLGLLKTDDRWATCFDGIATLPPAHVVTVGVDGFVARVYWRFDAQRRTPARDVSQYADAFRDHFDRAVRRRLRGADPVAVSLSGGLDSSSVYCMAQTQRRTEPAACPPVVGISYVHTDGSPADETRYLADIEQAYGSSIYRHPVPPHEDFLRDVDVQLRCSEIPLLSLEWQNFSGLLAHAREMGARRLLTGQSADQVLLDEAYLVDLARQWRWRQVWADLRELPRWLTDAEPGVFNRDFVKNLIKFHCPSAWMPPLRNLSQMVVPSKRLPRWYTKSFRNHVRGSLALDETPPPPASAYVTSMYRYLQSPLLAVANEWYSKTAAAAGLDLAAPFLDRELVAFLLTVPGDVQAFRGVPKALLRQSMRSVLPASVVGRRSKGDYTDRANTGVRRIYSEVARALRSGSLVAEFGYVDRKLVGDELTRLESRIQGPLFTAGFRVWRLIGLERWLQLFFGSGQYARAH